MKMRKTLGQAAVAVGLLSLSSPALAVTDTITIQADQVASIVNGGLTDAKLTLHNRGNWNGGSYFNPFSSFLRMFGKSGRVAIPPIHATIAQTKYMYYANSINSEAIIFQRENGGFVLKIPFESAGTEIKGLCRKRRGLGKKRHWGECRYGRGNDNPAPDANINDLMIKVPVQLFRHTTGGVSGIALRIPNCDAISVRAKVEINGILGWGDNNRIEQFAHKQIRNGVRDALCNRVNSDDLWDDMAQHTASAISRINATLGGAASVNVTRVNSNGSIVVQYSMPLSLDDIEMKLRDFAMKRTPKPANKAVAACRGKLAYTVRFRPVVDGRLEFEVFGQKGKRYAVWKKNIKAGKLVSMDLKRPVDARRGKLISKNGQPAIQTKTFLKYTFKAGGESVSGTTPSVSKTLKCLKRRIVKVGLKHKDVTKNAKTGKGKANVVATFRSAYAGRFQYQFEGENGALTAKKSRSVRRDKPVQVKVLRTLGGPKSKSVTRKGKRIVTGKSRMHWAIVVNGKTFKGVTKWKSYKIVFKAGSKGSNSVISGEKAASKKAVKGKSVKRRTSRPARKRRNHKNSRRRGQPAA